LFAESRVCQNAVWQEKATTILYVRAFRQTAVQFRRGAGFFYAGVVLRCKRRPSPSVRHGRKRLKFQRRPFGRAAPEGRGGQAGPRLASAFGHSVGRREFMSRSPWFLLSLATPVVLGALTVAAVLALPESPARTLEPPSLDSSRAGEAADETTTRGPQDERAPALTPPRTDDKTAPGAKPRSQKPPSGEGPVLYAAREPIPSLRLEFFG
jgi:hypothetical protein